MISKFSILIIISATILFQPGNSFGLSELLEGDPYYSSEEYGQDMARLFCLLFAIGDLEPCAQIPSNSNPEFLGVSNVQLLQNFLQFSHVSTLETLELDISSEEFWLSDDFSEETWNQQYVSNFKKINEIMREFSSYTEELQYRGFVFEPLYFFDESCEVQYTVLLHEPEPSFPQSNSNEIEIIKWLMEDKDRISEWVLMVDWELGPNLSNVESDLDKEFFSEFYTVVSNLDDRIRDYQENRNQQSLNQLRKAIEDLEKFSEKNKEIMILSEIYFNDQTSSLEIKTQKISENYFGSYDSNCREMISDDKIREIMTESEILNTTHEQTTLADSLEYIEYKMEEPPSPKVQSSYGILPEAVSCKENFQLILKPNLESSACVSSQTNSILIQRGWISPDMV